MPWTILADSVAGTAHRDAPCQDAFRVFSDADRLAVAVADGAGSASLGAVGAALACEELIRRVEGREEPFTRDGMTALFLAVRDALVAEAAGRQVPPRELACTALLAVVGPASAAFAQIGDGAIVRDDGEGGYRVVFWPDAHEYANATDFLTDERAAEALRFEATAEPVAELAVLTDGLQRLALDFAARATHLPFFRPLFRALRAADDLLAPFRAFLDSPRVNERTDDDKTLVLAVRRP